MSETTTFDLYTPTSRVTVTQLMTVNLVTQPLGRGGAGQQIMALGTGDRDGIAIEGKIDLPAQFAPDPATIGPDTDSGTIAFIQMVTPGRTYTAGAALHRWSLNSRTDAIDDGFPNEDTTGRPHNGPIIISDSPGMFLTNRDFVQEHDEFTDTLMFKPVGTGSQWVGLKAVDWLVDAEATKAANGVWSLTINTPTSASDAYKGYEPEWSVKVQSGRWV